MQFLSLSLLAFVGALTVSATPLEKRADYRQLYNINNGDGVAFCKEYKCDCINYVPNDKSLYFQYSACQPGDYQGKNVNTKALAYCTFTDGSTTTTINQHMAQLTNSTIA